MRAILSAALLPMVCAAALCACDQDYAQSNSERQSFMGDIHAAPPSAEPSAMLPERAPDALKPANSLAPAAPSADASVKLDGAAPLIGVGTAAAHAPSSSAGVGAKPAPRASGSPR